MYNECKRFWPFHTARIFFSKWHGKNLCWLTVVLNHTKLQGSQHLSSESVKSMINFMVWLQESDLDWQRWGVHHCPDWRGTPHRPHGDGGTCLQARCRVSFNQMELFCFSSLTIFRKMKNLVTLFRLTPLRKNLPCENIPPCEVTPGFFLTFRK